MSIINTIIEIEDFLKDKGIKYYISSENKIIQVQSNNSNPIVDYMISSYKPPYLNDDRKGITLLCVLGAVLIKELSNTPDNIIISPFENPSSAAESNMMKYISTKQKDDESYCTITMPKSDFSTSFPISDKIADWIKEIKDRVDDDIDGLTDDDIVYLHIETIYPMVGRYDYYRNAIEVGFNKCDILFGDGTIESISIDISTADNSLVADLCRNLDLKASIIVLDMSLYIDPLAEFEYITISFSRTAQK